MSMIYAILQYGLLNFDYITPSYYFSTMWNYSESKSWNTSGAILNHVSKGTTFPTSKNCNYILQWESEVPTST